MRKAKLEWVAAAVGVVLLVAGCGSEGGSGKNKGGGSSSSSGSTTGGAEAGGGGDSPDAAAVEKEIEAAATAAGFVRDSSGEDVPAELKSCMVSWTPDAQKAADPKKSYEATVATLTGGGWTEGQKTEQTGSTMKTLNKGTWSLKASNHAAAGFAVVLFLGTDNTPQCEALFKADLEKNKKS
ncbi:hypothetical protein Q5762_33175 [Streptomyces sp. P9(2023)]|uniref:hypothetical protein n=1 Tax=Streptomyces sp. P9(2023) TaxID=3064394 RepID=UPI0028F44071|nr:hypothetical protein [Streptomyces sp. P9(2023)]MDT9693093.1 hypothetical protein [Streptomyces sp. P9(2023)]